jgi:hypothetical protein
MWLAQPIWASGQGAASTGRTHDRIRTNIRFRFHDLNPKGRPHIHTWYKHRAAVDPDAINGCYIRKCHNFRYANKFICSRVNMPVMSNRDHAYQDAALSCA